MQYEKRSFSVTEHNYSWEFKRQRRAKKPVEGEREQEEKMRYQVLKKSQGMLEN